MSEFNFDEKSAIDQAVKGIYDTIDDARILQSEPRLNTDRLSFTKGARWQFDQLKSALEARDGEIERLRNQIDQLTKSLKQKDAPYFGPSI